MTDQKEHEFTAIVRKYKSTIYAVCYMFSKNRDEINDLFQEILIRLWKGFDSFHGNSDIKTWLYRVSLNTCLDNQKSHRRRGETVSLSVDMDIFDETGDRALQTKQLYSRINSLGLFDRGIILLWLEGLSYEEIADILGISVKNVSVRLVLIKNQLKKKSDK